MSNLNMKQISCEMKLDGTLIYLMVCKAGDIFHILLLLKKVEENINL